MPKASKGGVAVELDNCVLSWGDNKLALDPITLCVKASEFIPMVGGHGRVYGKIGYVTQKPYIMNDTFRENVLMGAEYDEK
ncbi:hypothetical protein LPJ66_001118 [Kickxella alabastrina]|uniref:Uncharacterized protein n=1 Tax=Kickxella alabastrina TaxID=61397 RepID=A0ACC1IU33_9FUNG|nr:hypothetical protein LPJ66_001118 [Kickxella alabastrina]